MAMTLGTVTESQSAPVGDYILRLKAVSDEPSQYGDDDYRKWVFACEGVFYSDDDDADKQIGQEIWGATSTSLSLKSRGYQWCKALLRRDIAPGEELTAEDLVGKICLGSVVDYTKKDGSQTTRLEILKAYNPNKAKKARPEPEEDADVDF